MKHRPLATATGTDRPTGMLSAIFFVFGNYPPRLPRIVIVRSQSQSLVPHDGAGGNELADARKWSDLCALLYGVD